MTPDNGQFASPPPDPSADHLEEDPINKVSISNWKLLGHGALKGSFDAELGSGVVLHQCSLFEKAGRYWITTPQHSYRAGGVVRYKPLVSFADRSTAALFNDAALQALRALPEAKQAFQGVNNAR